jgi:hypothetical protein
VIDLLRREHGLRRKGQPESQDFISLDEPIEIGDGEKIDKYDSFTPPGFTTEPGVPTFKSVKAALLWWYDCDPEGAFRKPQQTEPRYDKRTPQPYVLPEWYLTWLDIGNAVNQLPGRDQEKVRAFLSEKEDALDRSLSMRLGKLLTRSGIQHR